MLFSNYVLVNEKSDLVSFQAKGASRITCRGLSDLQITGGKKPSGSFVVSGLKKDYQNLLIMTADCYDDRHFSGRYSFILEIECYKHQGKERTNVKQWESSTTDKIAVIDKDGNIEMRIVDRVFSTDSKRKDVSYYIGDPNVCLNYLAGRIGVDDVMSAAEETQKQIDLRQRCTHLENESKYLQEMLDRSEAANLILNKKLEFSAVVERQWKEEKVQLNKYHKDECTALREQIARSVRVATQLRDAVRAPFVGREFVGDDGFYRGFYRLIFRKSLIKKALELFPDNEK